MSEKLCRFSEVNWPDIVNPDQDPLRFCLGKRLPIYIKVRRDCQLVYIHCHRWNEIRRDLKFERIDSYSISGPCWKEDWRTLPAFPHKTFDEEIVFLRIDHERLAEIAVTGSTIIQSFSGDGFSIPRPYRVIGHNIRTRRAIVEYQDITAPILKTIDFYHALLVDKDKWKLASQRLTSWYEADLEECKVSIEVRECDLYFTSSGIETLKQEAQNGREFVTYPYAHKERMPGIYWMFQAAYAQNELKILLKDKVGKWLVETASKDTYRRRSCRTAKKFVWPEVHRKRGGGVRGDFNLEDLDGWTIRKDYEWAFISKGLSVILAIADWWKEITERSPSEAKNKLPLAIKLYVNKFEGLEVGDLVDLISGSRITVEEAIKFYEYLKGEGKKVRHIVDKE